MSRKRKRKPYRIIGAYDSETTNITGREIYAFPVVHQLGILSVPVQDVTADNVEDETQIYMYRHALDLYDKLAQIVETEYEYVPVIACHNLAFDMYGLAPFFENYDVRVLAKSQRKPITFAVKDESGNARLVLWDTLVFSGQSLKRMGEDAGYAKAVGKWDYDLIRTPETPLTPDEVIYAKDDIYTLLVWLSWWLGQNPDIEPEKLALNVVTKTGVVRERRKLRFSNLKNGRYNVGRHWLYINRTQAPKTDDELFTMQAATRGGFTFCASKTASIPFSLDGTGQICAAYDATSQHPAQMVSHRVPVNFRETIPEVLELAFKLIGKVTVGDVLSKWSKPFTSAFYAAFTFTNLRPKKGSVFEKHGIYPLASARFKSSENLEMNEDNGDANSQDENRRQRGYADTAVNPVFAFGKLVSADECTLYITELACWEIWQAYEWDDFKAEHGYFTGRFVRPCDMAVISVMQFYQAKNEFKAARGEYLKTGTITNGEKLVTLGFPVSLVSDMREGCLSRNDLEAAYLGTKSNLNSLFGIEASNEYRRDTVLTSAGIEYTGEMGICNKPKNPKAWYQYGQRIVGWSRIAQICTMTLADPHVLHIVNGDTDSVKFIMQEENLGKLDHALERLGRAIDWGKNDNCYRAKAQYPMLYDSLEGIGHYVQEFTTRYFCAAWNKAYCELESGEYSFTLAGIPSRDVYIKNDAGELELFAKRLNGVANDLAARGASFGQICDVLLGYNVTYTHDVTGLNARKFPEWGELVNTRITDYLGHESLVVEPAALALYPMPKTIGSLGFADNRANVKHALANRPSVNTEPVIVSSRGITRIGV